MKLSKESLKEFIRTQMHLGEFEELQSEMALFSTGLLDSFQLIDLISHIESVEAIKVRPMEVNLHNLDSIAKIIQFVEGKNAT